MTASVNDDQPYSEDLRWTQTGQHGFTTRLPPHKAHAGVRFVDDLLERLGLELGGLFCASDLQSFTSEVTSSFV